MSMKVIIRIGERQYNFLSHGEDVCKTVAELKAFSYCRFPRLKKEKDLRFYWHDQEGEEISVITSSDYRSFLLTTEQEKRRLYVEDREAAQVYASSASPVQTVPDPATIATRPVRNAPDSAPHATGPVHDGVTCDVCEQVVVGHRYRCLTCYDYDLCMTCEAKYRHTDHIMLRILRPILGNRIQRNLVFENLEQHARNLKLSPACPSEEADDDVVPLSNTKPRSTGVRHKPTSREQWQGKSQHSAVHQDTAAGATIVHEQEVQITSDAAMVAPSCPDVPDCPVQ